MRAEERSPPRLLSAAASGSLKPPPTERLRRAHLHLSYSMTLSRLLDTTSLRTVRDYLVHAISRRARGLRLRGSAVPARDLRRNNVLPSPSDDRVGDLSSWFSKLYTLPVAAPVYASDRTSRCAPQNSGSGWIRCSFPVGLFHSLLHAGLSRRTACPTLRVEERFRGFGG